MLSSEVMNSDPGIICFQHCISKVFCFNLPTVCPTCNCQLNEKDLKLLPFRLPYPFIKAAQYPCSIVLRPTNGDFLNDYNNSMDLHIAVTTSRGIIIEFDQNGLQKTTGTVTKVISKNIAEGSINECCSDPYNGDDNSNWSQSLLVKSVSEPWYDLWDSVLEVICKQPNWTVECYKDDSYNCYTFVLKFLQALNYDQKLTEAAQNKMKFCELYIVPKTIAAGKYISLYRRIRDRGLYSHLTKENRKNNNNDDESSNSSSNSNSSISSLENNNNSNNNSGIIGRTNNYMSVSSCTSSVVTYGGVIAVASEGTNFCQQEISINSSLSNSNCNNVRISNCCCTNSSRCTKLCTIEE